MILKDDGNKVMCERSETRPSTVEYDYASEGELILKSAKKTSISDRDVSGRWCSEDFPCTAQPTPSHDIFFPSEHHHRASSSLMVQDCNIVKRSNQVFFFLFELFPFRLF